MAATEKVIETMGEEGNILNIIEYVEDPNSILRKEGVEEVVAKYPNVEIVQTIAGMDSIEECTEKISNALAGLGDEVDGMVTTGYNPTVAAAQILTEMNNDRIAYVGIDDDPIVLKAIEEGYVTGTFAQSPYFQGYVTPILLMYLIQGHESKGFEFIDTFGIVVTQDNLDTFADDLWNAAFDAGDNALETWFK
jgi:ribose transport system substrate-binding protein